MKTTAINIENTFLLLPGQTRRRMMKNYTIAVAGTGEGDIIGSTKRFNDN